MRKIVIHAPGGYARLQLEEHPDPEPAGDEVCLQVHAAGVNFADCIVRMGLYASAKEYVGWPITPGFEFAGTVASVGEGVTDVAVGDEVFGVSRFGAYASRLCVPRGQVFAHPVGYSASDAAAFPTAFLTAWYALNHLCGLRPGASILVHSAAGGVGGALVQLARAAGYRAVAVVGAPHKVEIARELGANEVIDKSTQHLWSAARRHSPGGYDAVLDANGYQTLRQSYRHLAPEGRLVVYGFHGMLPRKGGRPNRLRLALDYLRTPRFNPFDLSQRNRGVLGFNLSFLFHRADLLAHAMEDLLLLAADGKLRKPRLSTFPMDRVADAHRAIESGQTVGKLVLLP